MALLYEKRGGIAYITINRPRALNALDPETFQELSEALLDFKNDAGSLVAILTFSRYPFFRACPRKRSLWPSW